MNNHLYIKYSIHNKKSSYIRVIFYYSSNWVFLEKSLIGRSISQMMRFFQPLHKGILNVSEHMRFMRIAVMFL